MSADRIDALERKLFNLSTAQTIGIAVVTVLALALAGVLAGTMLQREQLPLEAPPAGDGSIVGLAAVNHVALRPVAELPARFKSAAGVALPAIWQGGDIFGQTLSPQPVTPTEPTGVASPTPGASPGASPAPAPAPSPTPGTDAPGTPTGAGVDLGPGIVTVPTPPPWAPAAQSPVHVVMFDGRGNAALAITTAADPATDASGAVAGAFYELIASNEQLSNVAFGDPVAIQPFGSLVSAAVMPYESTFSDPQGSFDLKGALWVGIRQDGAQLTMMAQTTPPENFVTNSAQWSEVIDGAFNSFAGV